MCEVVLKQKINKQKIKNLSTKEFVTHIGALDEPADAQAAEDEHDKPHEENRARIDLELATVFRREFLLPIVQSISKQKLIDKKKKNSIHFFFFFCLLYCQQVD